MSFYYIYATYLCKILAFICERYYFGLISPFLVIVILGQKKILVSDAAF